MSKTRERVISYDIIRVIAILMVVLLHSAGQFSNAVTEGTSAYMVCNAMSAITRASVPLFVMLSGALMLDETKDIPAKKILKSALNLWLLLVVWSVIYSVFYHIVIPVVMGNGIIWSEVRYVAVYGNYHLWYLFMIVGLYAITPFIRCFVKKENASMVLAYIVVTYLVNSVIVMFPVLTEYFAGFRWGFANEYVLYYLTGWYITHIGLKEKSGKILLAAGVLSMVFMLVVETQPAVAGMMPWYSAEYCSWTVVLYSVALFAFAVKHFKNISCPKCAETIRKLSALSLGVYLAHDAVLTVVRQFTDIIGNISVEIIVNFVLTVVITYIFVAVVSKIPVVKKLVRG